MHHYEGAAGAERLVSVAFADGAVPTEFMEVLEYVRSKIGLPHGTATHVAAEANKVVGLPFTGKEWLFTQLRRLAVELTDE